MKTRLLAALCAALAAAPMAFATSSGLNHILTADVPPPGVLVLQSFTNFGNDKDADLTLGFKTGLDLFGQKFEFGADSHILPDKGGPVVLQAK